MTNSLAETGVGLGGVREEISQGIGVRARWAKPSLGTAGVNLLCALFFAAYAYLFWGSVASFWFHPHWTTDDALQQLFPFHAVHHPEVFSGDLITEVMRGYLPPLHYGISHGLTFLTGDPLVMGHWVMLLQLLLTLGFMFGAVQFAAGTPAAFLSMAWVLHSRDVVQRMTGGLPRGWAAVVITAYFFFAVRRNHAGILCVIFLGCLLHPPGTLIVALSYGMYLLWNAAFRRNRVEALKHLLRLMLLAPVFVVTVLYVVRRPEHIGQMVNYETAQTMPEFQSPDGRFPYLPFRPIWPEIKAFGFQAFLSRFHAQTPEFRTTLIYLIFGAFAALALLCRARKRQPFPGILAPFPFAAILTYLAARQFAFKLYVPDRHLQFPLCFFLIAIFSVVVWRAFSLGHEEGGRHTTAAVSRAWPGILGLTLLAAFIYFCSGMGLRGPANFNYSLDKKGNVFKWLRDRTEKTALVAGHPTFIDGTQLFAMRRAYVTTETAHPFYVAYAMEMRRRIELSLRAHYARDLRELLQILEPASVDYFVFERRQFYPEALASATYHPPHRDLVHQLASRHYMEYAYRELPQEIDLKSHPFMPFKDAHAVIVDVRRLKEFLSGSTGSLKG